MPIYGKTITIRTVRKIKIYMSDFKAFGTCYKAPIGGTVQRETEQNYPYTYPTTFPRLL